MPQPKKPAGQDAEAPQKEPHRTRIQPDGRRFNGIAILDLVRMERRVAPWVGERSQQEPPDVVGVLLGIDAPRDGRPLLAIARNGDLRRIPFADVGFLVEVPADQVLRELDAEAVPG